MICSVLCVCVCARSCVKCWQCAKVRSLPYVCNPRYAKVYPLNSNIKKEKYVLFLLKPWSVSKTVKLSNTEHALQCFSSWILNIWLWPPWPRMLGVYIPCMSVSEALAFRLVSCVFGWDLCFICFAVCLQASVCLVCLSMYSQFFHDSWPHPSLTPLTLCPFLTSHPTLPSSQPHLPGSGYLLCGVLFHRHHGCHRSHRQN